MKNKTYFNDFYPITIDRAPESIGPLFDPENGREHDVTGTKKNEDAEELRKNDVPDSLLGNTVPVVEAMGRILKIHY